MSPLIVIVLTVTAALAVASLVALFTAIKRARARRLSEVKERFEGQDLLLFETGANFFGQESVGVRQVRGNGVLAVSMREIFFLMWLPRKALQIPIEKITRVETARSHLGKTVGRTLLRIEFENSEGRRDSAAWLVRDLTKATNVLSGLLPEPEAASG